MSNFTEEEKRWLLERAGWTVDRVASGDLWRLRSHGRIIWFMPDPSTDPVTVLVLLNWLASREEGVQLSGFSGNGFHVDSDFGNAPWSTIGEALPVGEAVCRAALQLRESE